MTPRFFRSAAELRRWLKQHSGSATELWVGYQKLGSGRPSVTWQESVDQALCFGWIDGLRKSVDESRYMIRFTKRKPSSTWSAVNVKRIEALRQQGLMEPGGLHAFDTRRERRCGVYSYEQRLTDLPEPYAGILKKHSRAFAYFAAQPPSYRKAAIWWIIGAKQEPTRLRRLAQLVRDSECERRIKQFAVSRSIASKAAPGSGDTASPIPSPNPLL